jgi:lipopolysaccharide transport system ATP-binding protein
MTVISFEKVSKAYRLGQIGGSTLKEDFSRWCAKLRGKPDPFLKIGEEHHARHMGELFWALEDVSFEVKEGEVLGIIGRNGAGKSTLLKILSQVTSPTSGEIKIKGRIASLLEVGTGFHPELTGRENVFLNGAILGMTKAEIRKNFDEIVAFSGVEEFIDTPVKRYSSGMYVRLAFAVAAHLEPEILIVDEVLAVGDATFQQKCIGKMQDVSRGGRTVIFVSHSMQAVAALCNNAVWLQDGKLVEVGGPKDIISKYMERHALEGFDQTLPLSKRPRTGTGAARFDEMRVFRRGVPERTADHIVTGSSVGFELEINAEREIKDANVGVTFFDSSGVRLVDVNTALKGEFLSLAAGEKAEVRFNLEQVLLKPGSYRIELWLGRGGIEDIDFVRDAGTVVIYEDLEMAKHTETWPGLYQCRFTHLITKAPSETTLEAAKAGHP